MREHWDGVAVEWDSAEVEPGVRLHYDVAREGEHAVVLIHGYPQTAYEWRRVVPVLARASLRVVVLDHRGAGGSSKPPAATTSPRWPAICTRCFTRILASRSP